MTWELGRAVTIGRLPLVLVVVTSLLGARTPVLAITLGELQAVPSHSAPYTFRLPLLPAPHGTSTTAAVTVRQPPHTLAFVKQHVVEFRLRALADVELEVSYDGQTLNRLLLKRELQAARMRSAIAPASNLTLPGQAKNRDRPVPELNSLTHAVAGASNRSLIEREMEGIRQEIHRLVERVAPWEGGPPLHEDRAGDAISTVLTLMLGGCFIIVVTFLIMGYRMQRRAIGRERQRQAALTSAIRQRGNQLAAEVPRLPALRPDPRSRALHEAVVPVASRRRVRVAQKTRWQLRVWALGDSHDLTQEPAAEPIRPQLQTSRRAPSAPIELLEALAQLRDALMRLQGRPTMSTTATHPQPVSRQVPR